jgi:hypothetical protein
MFCEKLAHERDVEKQVARTTAFVVRVFSARDGVIKFACADRSPGAGKVKAQGPSLLI